jgi:hypothetical protein
MIRRASTRSSARGTVAGFRSSWFLTGLSAPRDISGHDRVLVSQENSRSLLASRRMTPW